MRLAGPVVARLGVVIVSDHGAADTIECLESLLRCPLPMKIVVVDNGAGDSDTIRAWAEGRQPASAGSAEMAAFSTPPMAKPLSLAQIAANAVGDEAVAPLSLIAVSDRLGHAAARNLGLRHLLADLRLDAFWLLGNDTVVVPDAPGAVLARMTATPRIGLCGTVVRHYHAPDRIAALNGFSYSKWTGRRRALGGEAPATFRYSPQDVADATDFVLDASLVASRAFLEQVGLMPEEDLPLFETAAWAERNRRLGERGLETAFAHGAMLFHKAGGPPAGPEPGHEPGQEAAAAGGKAARLPAAMEHALTRGRLRFTWRFQRLLWPWHWLLSWLMVMYRLLRRQPANAGAIARAALGIGMRR